MRTLQTQIEWCARVQWGLSLATVVMLGGFFLLVYRPSAARVQMLSLQIESKQRELDAHQSRARDVPVVALEVDRMRQRLERFDQKLPRQPELGEFIGQVTRISEDAALRGLTLNPDPPRRTELLAELPISMNFEGDFLNVFSFLHQTEQMRRLTRIRRVSIRNRDSSRGRASPSDGQVEVRLEMNIYFSEG